MPQQQAESERSGVIHIRWLPEHQNIRVPPSSGNDGDGEERPAGDYATFAGSTFKRYRELSSHASAQMRKESTASFWAPA